MKQNLAGFAPEAILSQRQNRYLVRQLCWVLTIEGGFVSQQSLGKAIPVKYRVENLPLAHRLLELVMRRRIAPCGGCQFLIREAAGLRQQAHGSGGWRPLPLLCALDIPGARRPIMPKEKYRNLPITYGAGINRDTNLWRGKAIIFHDEAGPAQLHTIEGEYKFTSEQDAQQDALGAAKRWIDHHFGV